MRNCRFLFSFMSSFSRKNVYGGEYVQFRDIIDRIGVLHAKAGVTPSIVLEDRLPLDCRFDFAILGGEYVDEVVYGIKGSTIVDNRIYWSKSKIEEFTYKV